SGHVAEVAIAFGQARVLCQKLVAEAPNEADERQLLARTCSNLGRIAQQAGQISEAENSYRQALAIEQKLVVDFPDRSDYQSELGQLQRRLELLGPTAPGRGRQAEEAGGGRAPAARWG